MTTEEKAKAYDEALAKARKLHDSTYHPVNGPCGTHYNNADLESIFPELAESEDEKIRKEIIGFLQDLNKEKFPYVDFSSWLAYLKKQKEQKPADIEQKVRDFFMHQNNVFTHRWK